MALKGSLEDLGIVDLIQFVNQARKTGALVVSGAGGDARLYYRKGNLIDARLGKEAGIEVLVRAVDWTSGEFEFVPDVETQEETIQMDLHRAVMQAVKIRDERKMEEERRKSEELARTQATPAPGPGTDLNQLMAMGDFLRHIIILDAEGRVVGQAHSPGTPPNEAEGVAVTLHILARNYPRKELRRAFIEDDAGTVVLAKLPDDRTLVVVADRVASLGVISVTVGKLTSRVNLPSVAK